MSAYGVRRAEAQDDVVDTLLKLGLNREMATMSIPFVWFRVATTDPYSPVIIGIVHTIQAKLASMGIKTRGDGFIDGRTTSALNRISGPRWKQSHWINVIDDVNFAGAYGLPAKEQAMGYLGSEDYGSQYMTMEGLPVTSWCSDRNPQGNCKAETNICKPMDAATLGIFKSLQRAVNTALGKGALDVDGRIGPKTVSATNKVLLDFPHTFGKFGHSDTLAAVADEVVLFLNAANANANKRPVADPTGGSPPSVAIAGGGVFNPPKQAGFVLVQFVKSPVGMASVAAAAVLFVMATSKKKPKKKARKPTRRRRLPKKRVTHSFY